MRDEKRVLELLEFIKKSPTSFHAVRNFEILARENGFVELDERSRFSIERGRSYYVKRDGPVLSSQPTQTALHLHSRGILSYQTHRSIRLSMSKVTAA